MSDTDVVRDCVAVGAPEGVRVGDGVVEPEGLRVVVSEGLGLRLRVGGDRLGVAVRDAVQVRLPVCVAARVGDGLGVGLRDADTLRDGVAERDRDCEGLSVVVGDADQEGEGVRVSDCDRVPLAVADGAVRERDTVLESVADVVGEPVMWSEDDREAVGVGGDRETVERVREVLPVKVGVGVTVPGAETVRVLNVTLSDPRDTVGVALDVLETPPEGVRVTEQVWVTVAEGLADGGDGVGEGGDGLPEGLNVRGSETEAEVVGVAVGRDSVGEALMERVCEALRVWLGEALKETEPE